MLRRRINQIKGCLDGSERSDQKAEIWSVPQTTKNRFWVQAQALRRNKSVLSIALVLSTAFASTGGPPTKAQTSPQNAATVLTQSRLLLRARDLGAAESGFFQYTRLQPDDPRGYFWLGLTRDESGNPNGALAAYRAAIERSTALGMDCAELRINLANCLIKLHHLTEAEYDCRRAIEIDPDLGAAHFYLARLLLMRGKAAQALTELERCRELDPQNVSIPYEYARAHLLLGEKQKAQEQLASYEHGLPAPPQLVNSARLLLQQLRKSNPSGQ